MNRFIIFILLLLTFALHVNADENKHTYWESYIDSTTQENAWRTFQYVSRPLTCSSVRKHTASIEPVSLSVLIVF